MTATACIVHSYHMNTHIVRMKVPYGTPFGTKLKIAYGHHVSKLRREKKNEKKRKEELYSLVLALTLYPLSTSYPRGRTSTLYCSMCEHKRAYKHKVYSIFLHGDHVSLHGDHVSLHGHHVSLRDDYMQFRVLL